MPHMNVYEEVEKMKEAPLTEADRAEIDLRVEYAKRWLANYADERFIFTLQESVPAATSELTSEQLVALKLLADKSAAADQMNGETLHALIHEVKEESGLSPKEFFTAIYVAFLGKESGPKVGWFLSTMDQEFVTARLRLER